MTTDSQNCDRHDKSDELDTGGQPPAPATCRSRSKAFAARIGRPKPGKRRDNIRGEKLYQEPKMGCAARKSRLGRWQVVWTYLLSQSRFSDPAPSVFHLSGYYVPLGNRSVKVVYMQISNKKTQVNHRKLGVLSL
jgi:hypothetical protein